ncbi:MAG TPA: 50S ribosomal protein L35 [Candidatus Brocadiia bacterium]|nr:50S ribosomal protein L35 [Candidatus Brocadiia bacterium]
MPKQKTHKGIAKRMKVSANGKVLRRRAGGSHLMSGKKQKTIRRLRKDICVSSAEERKIKRLLGEA